MKLTLGALAELESNLKTGTLIDLIERFEGGRVSPSDTLALIVAGLRGGGWPIEASDLLEADFEGGPVAAARAASQALIAAFQAPTDDPA